MQQIFTFYIYRFILGSYFPLHIQICVSAK